MDNRTEELKKELQSCRERLCGGVRFDEARSLFDTILKLDAQLALLAKTAA